MNQVRMACGLASGVWLLSCAVGCQTTGSQGAKTSGDSAAQAVAPAETPEQKAARQFTEAMTLLKSGGEDPAVLARASSALEGAVREDPSFAIAQYNLGVTRERSGDLEDAALRYRAAFDTDPKLDPAVENLGRLLEQKGESEAARDLYREAIEKNPEAVGPRIRLAYLARTDNDPKTAAKLAREALQFDAESIDAYRLLARLYAENQKNQLARLIAIRGQKLSDGDAELIFALALVAQNEKNVPVARELLQRVIREAPKHMEARVLLAQMALETRDWKTATTELSALVQAGQGHPSVLTNLGLAYKGLGQFEEARQSYEKALTADENYGAALLNMGILELRHLDQPAKAEEHLAKYAALTAGSSEVENLLQEARILIEAKLEEQRMLEQMAEAEAEAARLAAEQAAAEGASVAVEPSPSEGEGGPPPDSPDEGGQAPSVADAGDDAAPSEEPSAQEAPREAAPVEAVPRKKNQKNRKVRQKRAPDGPEQAPERDDDFFD